jgi:peptidoglycan biosynthesis protein MviN/MurJ (putative lipid II flippase)
MPVRALAALAGLATAALVLAPAAQADPTTDAFLAAVTNAGVGTADPATAVALGQSVCPMLSEQGQTTADAAANVADTTGMSLGGANLFTGIAISIFCPAMMSSIGNGESPIPLSVLGF